MDFAHFSVGVDCVDRPFIIAVVNRLEVMESQTMALSLVDEGIRTAEGQTEGNRERQRETER